MMAATSSLNVLHGGKAMLERCQSQAELAGDVVPVSQRGTG
ncbi:MAG: hypothetical protein AAYR33_07820 [Acetobacteraceae bacterium]